MLTETKQIIIRPATREDLVLCIDMILALRQETFWKNMSEPADPMAMLVSILYRLTTQGNFCLYVAEHDGVLVGLCGGELISHFLAPHVLILTEWAWWVVPEHRQGTVGARLWINVCDWARKQGVKYASRNRVLSKDKIGKALGTESFTVTTL